MFQRMPTSNCTCGTPRLFCCCPEVSEATAIRDSSCAQSAFGRAKPGLLIAGQIGNSCVQRSRVNCQNIRTRGNSASLLVDGVLRTVIKLPNSITDD